MSFAARLELEQRVSLGRGRGGVERTEPPATLRVPLLIQIQPLPCSTQLLLTNNQFDERYFDTIYNQFPMLLYYTAKFIIKLFDWHTDYEGPTETTAQPVL